MTCTNLPPWCVLWSNLMTRFLPCCCSRPSADRWNRPADPGQWRCSQAVTLRSCCFAAVQGERSDPAIQSLKTLSPQQQSSNCPASPSAHEETPRTLWWHLFRKCETLVQGWLDSSWPGCCSYMTLLQSQETSKGKNMRYKLTLHCINDREYYYCDTGREQINRPRGTHATPSQRETQVTGLCLTLSLKAVTKLSGFTKGSSSSVCTFAFVYIKFSCAQA